MISQLIKECVEGIESAQKTLYNMYAPKMLSICYRYARNYQTAEDMLQEGFIKVFCNIKKYRGEGSFEGWVRKIMVNTALEILRKNKSEYNFKRIDEIWDLKDENSEKILDVLSTKEIMNYIQQIPDGYREVLNLYIVEGYSHREISRVLKISEGNSKLRLLRARDMLKKMIVKNN